MGILAKASPSAANTDILLYKVPAGKQAVVIASMLNIDTTATHKARLAVIKDLDTSISTAAVVTGGSGYSSKPNITVTGNSTTTAQIAVNAMFVTSVAINTNGSGYTPGDVLTITGGTGTSATVRVATTAANGGITSVTVESGGSYTALIDTASAASATGGTGSGAKFDTIRYGIASLTVSNGGNGYAAAPTLAATQSGATGFSATVQMTQLVEDVDYIEYDAAITSTNVIERSGLILGPNETLFCRADAANKVNFAVWGIEEVA